MTPCPTCGQPFDAAVTGGICPACALRAALGGAAVEVTGDYEELGVLGRGAMGVVTLARQRSLHRLVALKTIPAGQSGADDLGARLLREARAAAQLQHPHIVAVHDLGRDDRGAYLAMEYCDGGTLRDRLRERPLPPREAAALAAKLAGALAHAHAAGVLHRDLKPSNVLLTAAGEPKLADFGLAGSTAGAGELTRVGEIAGSPSYLAPECLAADARPTIAVDVYGLGAVLYECVSGRPPFTGDTLAAVLAQVAAAEPAAPRIVNRGVPADLDTIILKCLEKAPAARYADAAALRSDLENFLAGRPIVARPLSPAGQAWRWARRNPVFAGTAAAAVALLLAAAVIASVAAFRIDHARAQTEAERDRAESALQRTTEAEHAARDQLRAALLAQAKATRFTAREGQRFAALAAVRQATAIRPGLDARNEAVAALIRPDWSGATDLKAWNDPGFSTATPLPGFGGFIHETAAGVFSRRAFPDGATVWTWPGPG